MLSGAIQSFLAAVSFFEVQCAFLMAGTLGRKGWRDGFALFLSCSEQDATQLQ